MRYRKLRIVWSAFCGIAAVLLIVLWVRSYSLSDTVGIGGYWNGYMLTSLDRRLLFTRFDSKYPYGKQIYWHLGIEIGDARPLTKKAMGYESYSDGSGRTIAIPHWLFIAPIATLATFPWVRWSQKFSLHTLLIATTLVAVALGLAVWTMRN